MEEWTRVWENPLDGRRAQGLEESSLDGRTAQGLEESPLDGRRAQDIRKEIAKLAAAYAPEWHFDEECPDIGSVLGLLFAEQMEWSLRKFNRKLEQFQMDFVNMLGLSRLPAHPAKSCVLFSQASEGFGGAFLEKGTKLSAEAEGKNIVFETSAGCYLTASRLTHCFMAEGITGVTLPLLGKFAWQDYLAEQTPEKSQDYLAEQSPEGNQDYLAGKTPEGSQDYLAGKTPEGSQGFAGRELFSFPERGMEKNALILAHKHMLAPENGSVYLKLVGKENLAERIVEGEFCILYPAREGFVEAEEVKLLPDALVIGRDKPTGPELVIEALKPLEQAVVLDEILVSSQGTDAKAPYAGNGTMDFDVEKFAPFGNTLQLFEECYIGDDVCFSKENAEITLDFQVSFLTHTVGLPFQEPEMEDLRLVKRKPPMQPKITPAKVFAEEISLEYFNGKGWKRLACQQDYKGMSVCQACGQDSEGMSACPVCGQDYKGMFASARPGDYQISFLCPRDFHPSQIGSYEGRCIRMRLMKADNCYTLPALHAYPVLEHLKIRYSYEGRYEKPSCLERVYGAERRDLAARLTDGKPVCVFAPSRYRQNALYLGFEKKWEGSPVNLYFEFSNEPGFSGRKLIFEYASRHGFRELRALDGTEGFAHTGIVSVMAPGDSAPTEEAGVCRYWLRIREESKGQTPMAQPFLNQVRVNGVWVQNIESLEEEEFYLEQVRPGMHVRLSEHDILDADIWVNEKDCCSKAQMEALLQDMPKKTRAEYDTAGHIQNFYVKWEEVLDFENSRPQDRHYILDRAQGELRFGDGVHVKIPGVTGDVTFCAAVRVCDGADGNVPAGAIRNFVSKVPFYGSCYNPLPAFGGAGQETMDKALQRGAGQFSSRRRVLTRLDYIREVKSYSDNIDKVSCLVGRNPAGAREPGHICLVALMKDFAKGPDSFIREADGIKEHLYARCEMSIPRDKLSVAAPIPVEISVELWIKKEGWEESFQVQNKLIQALKDFLNPISNGSHTGWEIGELPKPSQILLCLRRTSCKEDIQHIMITGKYQGRTGVCEMELEKIPDSLFFICKSGQHKVHILEPRQPKKGNYYVKRGKADG